MHRAPFFRPRLLPLPLAAAAVLVAPPAHAATYCVADPACAAAGGNAKPSIQMALAVAGSTVEADTVRVGSGTFTGNLEYLAASPVSIVGAGRDQTFLRGSMIGPPNYLRVLRMASPAGTANVVTDLTVELTGAGARGLEVSNGATARRVDIVGTPQHAFGLIVEGAGSLAEDLAIDLDGDGNVGAYLAAETAVLQRSTINADNGVHVSGGLSATSSPVVRGLKIKAGRIGIQVAGGKPKVESTLIDVRGATGARGLWVEATQSYKDRWLFGRHLTVVGSPSFGDARGLLVESDDPTRISSFELSDSVITGFATAVELRSSDGGWAKGILRSSYHGPFLHSNKPNGQGGLADIAPVQVFGDVGFTDPAHGNFTLRDTSPLVDAGSEAPFLDLDGPLDVTGAPRVTDGNGDGKVRRDVGAFERPAPAPAPVVAAEDGADAVGAGVDQGGVPPVTPETVSPAAPKVETPANVTPPASQDTAAPQLSRLRVTTAGRGKRRTYAARFATTEASTVTVSLTRKSGKRWAAVKGSLAVVSSGGPTKLALPKKLGGKTLRRGTYRLTALARDAAGNTGTAQEVTFRLNP